MKCQQPVCCLPLIQPKGSRNGGGDGPLYLISNRHAAVWFAGADAVADKSGDLPGIQIGHVRRKEHNQLCMISGGLLRPDPDGRSDALLCHMVFQIGDVRILHVRSLLHDLRVPGHNADPHIHLIRPELLRGLCQVLQRMQIQRSAMKVCKELVLAS